MSELPDNNRDEARRWLANVEDDMATPRAAHRDPDSPARMTCFLAHLIVEKSLKATLIDAGVPFKKVHNLLDLHDTCVQVGRLTALDRRMLASCNPWAIDGRYADDLIEAERGLADRLADFAEATVEGVRIELEATDGDQ